jgi:hypothetical protein
VTASQLRDLRGQQAERQWQGRQLQNDTGSMAVAAQRSRRSNVVAEAQSLRSDHRSEVAAAQS